MKHLKIFWTYLKKSYKNILLPLAQIFVGLLLILIIFANFSVFGLRLFKEQSGSMAPVIQTGSLIVTKSQSTYQVGDIVTFWEMGANNKTITHRIYREANGGFQTKGDANDSPDGNFLDSTMIVGKVLLIIPLLGYFVHFAQTLPGLIIFVFIPAFFIVTAEVHKIRLEARKIRLSKVRK